jgi:hypothetical protein
MSRLWLFSAFATADLSSLQHVASGALARELEFGHRLVDLQAADRLRQQVQLLTADAVHAQHGAASFEACFGGAFWLTHDLFTCRLASDFLVAAMAWEVRVGANSPSL